jgi:hypothetical protein
MQEAVGAWVTVYSMAKQMNLAQALQALANLAPQLGLPEGLDGWEMLAQRMESAQAEGQQDGQSELEQIREFARQAARAAREKSPEAGQYFENVSKLATDPAAPPELRAFGRVLRDYMAGVPTPDLSGLSEEIRRVVQEAFGD